MAGLASLFKILFTLFIFVHLTLYNLHSLIPLYPSLLSSKHTRYLFLYTLPYCLSKNIVIFSFQLFFHLLSRHLPSIKELVTALLWNHSQYENNSLQPTKMILTQTSSWNISTTMHLWINYVLKNLAVACRKAIAHNLLCIISCRLVYLEHITVSINHFCYIMVPLSLKRIIFNSMHALPATGHMGEYKKLYRLKLR